MLKMLSALILLAVISAWQTVEASEKNWVIVIDPGHGGKIPDIGQTVKRRTLPVYCSENRRIPRTKH